MAISVPTGALAEEAANAGFSFNNPNQVIEPGNPQGGPTNPPYLVAIILETPIFIVYQDITFAGPSGVPQVLEGGRAALEARFGFNAVYPPRGGSSNELNASGSTNTQDANNNAPILDDTQPFDKRLIFITNTSENPNDVRVVYSYSADPNDIAPLVDGFVINKSAADATPQAGATPTGDKKLLNVQDKNLSQADYWYGSGLSEFRGVPSLMSNNSYINFIASGGASNKSDSLKVLVDREGQKRWYDNTAQFDKLQDDNTPVSTTQELTVNDLIFWSQKDDNKKFPYRYQDFVFCKWFKKIPLNYMVTLRRYTRPVIDNVTSGEDQNYKNSGKGDKLASVAHAVTYLGEDTGNKISSILGPIEAKLKWKEFKADVWEITPNGSPADASSPFPNLSRAIDFGQSGVEGARDKPEPVVPPDPYNNGPYANKIYGPVTVIDSTMGRERGIEFTHSITLQFEYVARSIGGVNSKAVMLDIIGNLMILTFNTAPFWGGENRMMPNGNHGSLSPFLGGDAGKQAWIEGNPDKFFDAVMSQVTDAKNNLTDLFNKILDDPIEGLKSVAAGGASAAMKLNSTRGKVSTHQLRSILTGEPIGEWHITVGNPMNPMMMVGNLICDGIKIEFSDELGPDDFPTEIKATVTLKHGMPRDKTAIESMFNKGSGRLYSVPPGLQSGLDIDSSAIHDTKKDESYYKNTKQYNSQKVPSGKYKNPLLGDPTQIDRISSSAGKALSPVYNSAVAIYNHGFAKSDGDKKPDTKSNSNK